jgi:homoserine trans-succinylase
MGGEPRKKRAAQKKNPYKDADSDSNDETMEQETARQEKRGAGPIVPVNAWDANSTKRANERWPSRAEQTAIMNEGAADQRASNLGRQE